MTNKQIIVLLILVIYMAVNMIVGLKSSKLPAKNQKTGPFFILPPKSGAPIFLFLIKLFFSRPCSHLNARFFSLIQFLSFFFQPHTQFFPPLT